MATRALPLLVVILATGCTVFNRPDPSRLDAGTDADIDTGVEVGPLDAGVDAPDAPPCTGPEPDGETTCNNGRDDDCDQLRDCADPDCTVGATAATECCTASSIVFDEAFTSLDSSLWAGDLTSAAIRVGALSDFGGGSPRGAVRQSAGAPLCVPLELGTDLQWEVTVPRACPSGDLCFAQVVLGPSRAFVSGSRLVDDLAVRTVVTGNVPEVQVVQGGIVRGRSTVTLTPPLTVRVHLAPSVVAGQQVVTARVTVISGPGGPEDDVIASDLLVVERSRLSTLGCGDSRGLFLGVEGHGAAVGIGHLELIRLNCVNPARFDRLDDVLDARDLSALGWGSGGVGDPTLMHGQVGGTGARWTLLVDGSTVDRSTESIARLPLGLGGADSSEPGLQADCNLWQPRVGPIERQCTPSSAGLLTPMAGEVMRDPTVADLDQANLGIPRVMWAQQSTASAPYELYYSALEVPTASTLSPHVFPATFLAGDGCGSRRAPLLLPLIGDETYPWLLLYLCDDGAETVRAARVAESFSTGRAIPEIVIDSSFFGPAGDRGIVDMAGAVWLQGEDVSYRLWVLTRSSRAETATRSGTVLSFVEGSATVRGSATGGAIPVFAPYAGNPVLLADDPVLPRCDGRCELHGIAATRVVGTPNVRLLLERWDTTSSETTYGLVPLQQTWPDDEIF